MLSSIYIFAQDNNFKRNEYIVQFENSINLTTFMLKFNNKQKVKVKLKVTERLIPNMNIYLLNSQGDLNDEIVLEMLRAEAKVEVAQFNHLLSQRSPMLTTSNDPRLTQQWQHINTGSFGTTDADLDSDEAWDITTGGLTPSGDTIVVAILDDGIDVNHADLLAKDGIIMQN